MVDIIVTRYMWMMSASSTHRYVTSTLLYCLPIEPPLYVCVYDYWGGVDVPVMSTPRGEASSAATTGSALARRSKDWW